MKSKDIIRIIQAAGWTVARQKGSHCQFTHPDFPYVVTVPHPKRNVGIGLIKNIERATGLKIR